MIRRLPLLRLLPRTVLGLALLLNACVLLSQGRAPALGPPQLDELSGLAVSRADPDLLWGHNDSGAPADLFRLGRDGRDLGQFRVPGIEAHDWEDIAAFTWRGQPALLIADIGDNRAERRTLTLYAVRDPGRSGAPTLLWRLDFRYDGGPRDCEAITVTPDGRHALLLTKRENPKRLYRLALPEREPPVGIATAELLGEVTTVPQPSAADLVAHPFQGRWFGQPTAMDLSRDGRTLAVLTYQHVLVWQRREADEAWLDTFARPPTIVAMPALFQAEALALTPDTRAAIVSSEGVGAPLVTVPLPQAAADAP